VVHLCGGVAGLAGSYISGPRLGRYNAPYNRRAPEKEGSKEDKYVVEEYKDEIDGYDKAV
jgi:ammonia channel protein AmtB